MKNRFHVALLAIVPALLCATAAQSQDALRKAPQPEPPAHNGDVSHSLHTVLEGGALAQSQIDEHLVNQIRHVTGSLDRLPSAASMRLHAVLGQSGPALTPSPVLLINTREMDPMAQSHLEEDLNVMSRIVQKAIQTEPTRGPRAMGIELVLGPDSPPVRSLYLDGYGVLFIANVNFPLLPLPSRETDAEEEPKPPTESAWEQARQEVYGVPHPPEPVLGIGWTPEDDEQRAYLAEKVEGLRQRLFEAIKNAKNIRQLAAEDSVTLCIVGSPAARSDVRVIRRKPAADSPEPRYGTSRSETEIRLEEIVVRPELKHNLVDVTRAIMTLQAKKADIDRFAQGEMILEEFRNLAGMQTYLGGRGWNSPSALFWNNR